MKTIEDLKKLYPTLIEMVRNNFHEIGETYFEEDEDGCGFSREYENNCVCYERDGWYIEITYACSGEWSYDPGDYWTAPYCELINASGILTEIFASYYDEDTDNEIEFSQADMKELWDAIDHELQQIS